MYCWIRAVHIPYWSIAPVGSGGGVDEVLDEVIEGLLDMLAKLVDVLKGSFGLLSPSSSSNESGARVHAGASDVAVLVSV